MATNTTIKTSAWIAHVRPNPQARLRLFCLPYSGGNASIFAGWADILPAAIEVCPIQLPGHGSRIAEPPLAQIGPLVEAIAGALLPFLDRPFAFFGHSMGALLSFELARLLRRRHGLSPVGLYVSAHRAPQLPDRGPELHALPEPAFWDELRRLNGTPPEVLAHAELRQLIEPILRADFSVCEVYTYTDDEPLACPITAFGGLQDHDVTRDELAAWREQTRGAFALRMLPGDHFFINTARMLLLQALARELAQWLGPDSATANR
jgi:medium-chain acyl-[acyl-carrier-protein] hydrolase